MSELLTKVASKVKCLHIISDVSLLPKGHIRMETGLLYPDRTSVELYLAAPSKGQKGFVLTDFGQTISWLMNVQIKLWQSKTRKKMIEDAIGIFGVVQKSGAFQLELESLDEITEGVFKLGQVCTRVADLAFTKRMVIQSSFSEDVEEVLSELDLNYELNKKLTGRFGRLVEVDYYVQGKTLKSMILTLSSGNSPTAHVAANEVFTKWYDLSDSTRTEQKITIFDDSKNAYREEDMKRLNEVSIVLPFSANNDIRSLLAA